jgi:hypothetical protein
LIVGWLSPGLAHARVPHASRIAQLIGLSGASGRLAALALPSLSAMAFAMAAMKHERGGTSENHEMDYIMML